MSDIIEIFLLAMTPIGELRAAIPVGLGIYHLDWPIVYFVSVLGNLIPVVILFLFFEKISFWLNRHFKAFERFFNWLFSRTRTKHQAVIQKYGWWGLMLFVAIPLPMTGAWTGVLLAFLLDFSFWHGFSAVAVGVIIAGLLVLLAFKAGLAVESFLGWPMLLVVLVLIMVAGLWFRNNRPPKPARLTS